MMTEMIDSLEIVNFRCFRDLRISSLGRVNLIAGVNNVGKTALLEAISLLAAPNLPTWPPPLDFFRGFTMLPSNVDLSTRWGWLFYQRDMARPISLKLRIGREVTDAVVAAASGLSGLEGLATGHLRSLEIRWQPTGNGGRSQAETERSGTVLLSLSIESGDSNRVFNMVVTEYEPPLHRNMPSIPLGVISGGIVRGFEEDARRFSEMYLSPGGIKSVIEALRVLEPRLTDLRVLNLGGISMLYGEIGIGRPLPLSQMGDGVGRMLSIVLEITKAAGGIVLIDEVEHGLHHSAMANVWRLIDAAARRSNVQVFATTHRWECIQAAHMAFEQDPTYDLRLYRLERVAGDIKVVAYDRETLGTSVDMNLEVR